MNHRNMGFRAKLMLAAVLLFASGSVFAQATRTWVSGVGDDANPCSRTAPCKTFAGAISKTATGGYINVIDPGGFGALTITKSITVDGGPFHSGMLASSTSGVIINGAGIVVRLRNLTIEGGPPTSPGTYGVRFLQGAALIMDNVEISDFRAAASGYGVYFAPNTAAVMSINNCLISNNIGPGILIQPGLAGLVRVAIANTRVYNNQHGIVVEDRSVLAFSNGEISSNVNSGLKADSASASVQVVINGSQIANNGATNAAAAGVKADGAAATVVIGGNTISGNYNGIMSVNGAVMASFGNNQIYGNTVGGLPTVTVPTR